MRVSSFFVILAGIIPFGFPLMLFSAFFGLITVTEAAEIFTWYLTKVGYWFPTMVFFAAIAAFFNGKGK